jgi:hypothetical protein
MTLSELRGELERRGLDLAGSKASLELRLAQAMVQEVGGPDAAGLMGQTGAKAAEVRLLGCLFVSADDSSLCVLWSRLLAIPCVCRCGISGVCSHNHSDCHVCVQGQMMYACACPVYVYTGSVLSARGPFDGGLR